MKKERAIQRSGVRPSPGSKRRRRDAEAEQAIGRNKIVVEIHARVANAAARSRKSEDQSGK